MHGARYPCHFSFLLDSLWALHGDGGFLTTTSPALQLSLQLLLIWWWSFDLFSSSFTSRAIFATTSSQALGNCTCKYSIVTQKNSFYRNKWLLDMQMKGGISVPQKSGFPATGSTTSAVGEAYWERLDRYKVWMQSSLGREVCVLKWPSWVLPGKEY